MKKSLKRIMIFLVIAVAIILFRFPTNSYATTIIDKVYVGDIEKPEVGNLPDRTASTAKNYSIYDTIDWYEVDTDRYLKDSDRFEFGHIYRVVVWVKADAGYEFKTSESNPNVLGYINMKSATVNKALGEAPYEIVELTYEYDFSKPVTSDFTLYAKWEEISSITTGWQQVGNTWYYFDENGTVVIGWQYINSKWYYFDNSGAMVTGWQKIGNTWYYFEGSGAAVTGWKNIGSKWYYFNNSCAMVTGWQKIGNIWYYFEGSGAAVIGWKNIGSKWYYFNSSYAMVTGWQEIENKWYYFESSGAMRANTWYKFEEYGRNPETNEYELLTYWYYLKSNGARCINEWLQLGNDWYYFDENAKMATGVKRIGDNYYAFDNSGKMLRSVWARDVGFEWNYELNGYEKKVIWFYVDASGKAIHNNWLLYNQNWYYFYEYGPMVADNVIEINGYIYAFDKSGKMIMNNWFKSSSNTWFYLEESGAAVIGWRNINGKWYYFDGDCAMVTGWQKIGNKWYYFETSGEMFNGSQKNINGTVYSFDSSGAWIG